MPLFKTRTSKIRPCDETSEMETLRVENVHPKLELFVNVSSNATNDNGKKRLLLSERMDDPEEICELSPLSLYYRQSESLMDISSNGDKVFFRRSMNFSPSDFLPPPNFLPTRSNHANINISDYDNSFVADDDTFPIWKRKETGVCIDRSLCKGTRWHLKDVDKTAHFKRKLNTQMKTIKRYDLQAWVSSPDRFYNYIFKLKHTSTQDLELNVNTVDERLKNSLVYKSGEHRVWFPSDVLVFACVLENLKDDLEFVLRYSNLDLNVYTNARDLSPLHVAAQLGYVECIQVLLHYGANVNYLDSQGHSPLYKAFAGQHFECAVILIEAGADINQFTRQKAKEIERIKKVSLFYGRNLEG